MPDYLNLPDETLKSVRKALWTAVPERSNRATYGDRLTPLVTTNK